MTSSWIWVLDSFQIPSWIWVLEALASWEDYATGSREKLLPMRGRQLLRINNRIWICRSHSWYSILQHPGRWEDHWERWLCDAPWRLGPSNWSNHLVPDSSIQTWHGSPRLPIFSGPWECKQEMNILLWVPFYNPGEVLSRKKHPQLDFSLSQWNGDLELTLI